MIAFLNSRFIKDKTSIVIILNFNYVILKGDFFFFFLFMFVIQHCFICRPSDSNVSEDAGIEPRTVVRLWHWQPDALTTRIDLTVERLYCKRPILCLASSKILTLHPTHHPASVYPPPLERGEDTLVRGRGGWVNILEDARHSSVLYICKYFVDLIHIQISITVLGSEVWKRRCLASVEERAKVLPHVVHV